MQHLLSKGLGLGGLGASARSKAAAASTHAGPGNLPTGAHSLHVHVPRVGVPLPPPPVVQSSAAARSASTTAANTASTIFQTTRTAITRFFAHVATPGLTHPVAESLGTTISARANAAVRSPTIQARISMPMRFALSQPKPFLPRPTPAGRNITQVGLGTARNFSTGRPIFQHIVENAPIATRAFYEADLDVRKKMMKNRVRKEMRSEKQKENVKSKSLFEPIKMSTSSMAQSLEHYFPCEEPAAPGMTTILLVPLAPSPTARFPLSATPSDVEPRLLIFSQIQDVLASHQTHSLRVSSLFARLDLAHVWEKGATFSAHGDTNGLCTLLRVEFKGWNEAMVWDILGDAGKGWCKVIETNNIPDESEGISDVESGMSSMLSSRASPVPSRGRSPGPAFDPASSFVLPTLDFSSSFAASRDNAGSFLPSPPLHATELSFSDVSPPCSEYDVSDEDRFSDGSSESWESEMSVDSSGSGSLMAFSSAFLARAEAVELVEISSSPPSPGPREEMFF